VWTAACAGAVATTAGSPPVAVPPPKPTLDGNKDGYAFVGEGGGKWWTLVEPTIGGANMEMASCSGV